MKHLMEIKAKRVLPMEYMLSTLSIYKVLYIKIFIKVTKLTLVTCTDFHITETGPHMQKHTYFSNFHDHEQKI